MAHIDKPDKRIIQINASEPGFENPSNLTVKARTARLPPPAKTRAFYGMTKLILLTKLRSRLG